LQNYGVINFVPFLDHPVERYQLTQGYGTIIRRTCMGDGCRQQHCIQKCGQTAADRDIFITDSL